MDLSELTQKLLSMAGRAEAAVTDATSALIERDYGLALRVNENDRILDQLEIEIDDLAVHLLAKAPLARDLRFVMVAIKISQNLERVGDEAAKIAKRARDLSQEAPLKLNVDLAGMEQLVLSMLKSALDAFVQRDPALARSVIPLDKEVDNLNKQISKAIAEHMAEKPDTIPRCLHLLTVSKSLERIADHAKNLAEEVVYLCEAVDIRHSRRLPAAQS